MAHYLQRSPLVKVVTKPGTWFIIALVVIISLPHYADALQHPAFLNSIMTSLGFTRHTFERILYLIPIVWAGFIFGWTGAFFVSLVALACMLPRVLFFPLSSTDALFETAAVFIMGNIVTISFNALRSEREYRTQLELSHHELRASEGRYRELFDNAHDAIWLHDLDKNIITANKACAALTGYSLEEICEVKSGKLFAKGCLEIITQFEDPLHNHNSETGGYISEATIVRKDGSAIPVELSTSPVVSEGQIAGFQHIARDATEQKRMQENLHFYLHQTTRAQEEERKRISRELHDDTIQDLVVLSRQLDVLASSSEGLSEDKRARLEELWQQANNIMRGLRRLSQDLRPAALDSLGLLPALEWLASDTAEYSGIMAKVNTIGTSRCRLYEEVELVLFRIAQEALRNVWRHAQATEADIAVEFGEYKTIMTITDNGNGFSPPRTVGDLARDGKLGLTGMQERAKLIGATLTLQSEPGKGTRVIVEIPA
ncbi:PAS domain S-box protein [Chloroflexota bacterium]